MKKILKQGLLVLAIAVLCVMANTTEAKAYTTVSPTNGTVDVNSGTNSGITNNITEALQLRYVVDSHGDAYISGYQYRGPATDLHIEFPAQITDMTTGQRYNVKSIAANAFENCWFIQSVSIPSCYQSVGAYAFSGCTALEGLSLGQGVANIGKHAFYGCTRLGAVAGSGNIIQQGVVTIPASVLNIEAGAFAACNSISTFAVEPGNMQYKAVNGMIYSYDGTHVVQCPAGWAPVANNSVANDVVLGTTITTINTEAFAGCTNIRTVTIDAPVRTIGEKAFYGCTALLEMHIAETVTYIGEYALSACNAGLVMYCHKSSTGAAESFANAYGITKVVTCTVKFYNDGQLIDSQEITMGSSAIPPVLTKDGQTLSWDTDYTNVTQNLTIHAKWGQNYTVTFKDSVSGKVMQVQSYYGGKATPPDWRREGYVLGWDSDVYKYVTGDHTVHATWMISMTDIKVDNDRPRNGETRTIGKITYMVTDARASNPEVKVVGCTNSKKTTLTIPDTITFGGETYRVVKINKQAFDGMNKLTTVTIGKHVESIGKGAFSKCTALKKITIYSKKLKSSQAIKDNAFKGTYVKAKINVPNSLIKRYRTNLQDAGLSVYATVY